MLREQSVLRLAIDPAPLFPHMYGLSVVLPMTAYLLLVLPKLEDLLTVEMKQFLLSVLRTMQCMLHLVLLV